MAKPVTKGGCIDDTTPEQERDYVVRGHSSRSPLAEGCGDALPKGTSSASVRPGYLRTFYGTPPSSISVVLQGSALASVDGVPCEAVFPGESSSPAAVADQCGQMFMCGCCGFELHREHEMAPFQISAHVSYCGNQYTGNDYYIGGYPMPGGGGGTGGGPSSGGNACNDCLSGCQGLSGCCTGSGCICQSACAPSSTCLPGSTYCCGPDFCFCTDSCPY